MIKGLLRRLSAPSQSGVAALDDEYSRPYDKIGFNSIRVLLVQDSQGGRIPVLDTDYYEDISLRSSKTSVESFGDAAAWAAQMNAVLPASRSPTPAPAEPHVQRSKGTAKTVYPVTSARSNRRPTTQHTGPLASQRKKSSDSKSSEHSSSSRSRQTTSSRHRGVSPPPITSKESHDDNYLTELMLGTLPLAGRWPITKVHKLKKPHQILLSQVFTLSLKEIMNGQDLKADGRYPVFVKSSFALGIVIDLASLPGFDTFLANHFHSFQMRMNDFQSRVRRSLMRSILRQWVQSQDLTSSKEVVIGQFKNRAMVNDLECRIGVEHMMDYFRAMYCFPRWSGRETSDTFMAALSRCWKLNPNLLPIAITSIIRMHQGWMRKALGQEMMPVPVPEVSDPQSARTIYQRIIVTGTNSELVKDMIAIVPCFLDHQAQVPPRDAVLPICSEMYQKLQAAPDVLKSTSDDKEAEHEDRREAIEAMEGRPQFGPEAMFGATGRAISDVVPPYSLFGGYLGAQGFVPDLPVVGVRSMDDLQAVRREFDVYRMNYYLLAEDDWDGTVIGTCVVIDTDAASCLELRMYAPVLEPFSEVSLRLGQIGGTVNSAPGPAILPTLTPRPALPAVANALIIAIQMFDETSARLPVRKKRALAEQLHPLAEQYLCDRCLDVITSTLAQLAKRLLGALGSNMYMGNLSPEEMELCYAMADHGGTGTTDHGSVSSE